MKKLLIPVFTGAWLCLAHFLANAQEFKTHISKEFTQQKGTVAICNLWGSVKVEGYSGDKVMIEVDETIKADDQSSLETAKKEFKLGFEQVQDSVLAYTAEPYNTRPHHSQHNHETHMDYTVKLEYTVKIPFNTDLYVSTVNDGHISVKNVYGTLKINNVNGPIEIINAKGTTNARTVNGAVTVNYLSIPPDACSYYTINGEVNVTFPKGLSADLELKSMNGQFYTDFPDAEILPNKITKTETKNGSGTTYKLNKTSDARIGSGGKTFKFETLNGNIYIKKQQS